jgi:hypothetical protein
MYNYQEEEKRLRGMIGAPLAGMPYQTGEAAPAPIQEKPAQPGVAEQLGKQYAMGQASKQLDKGISYAGNQAKNMYNSMQGPEQLTGQAPLGEVAQTGLMEPTAADVAAFNAPLAEAPMQLGVEGTALAPTEVAQTGLMDASTAGAADASTGMAASTAGPLAGAVEYARTGDVKKGVGAGAGAAAGATVGSMILPGPGTVIGSVIGSQLGSAVGGK